MKQSSVQFFDHLATTRARYVSRHRTYYRAQQRLISAIVPADASVIELGSGTGAILKALPNAKKFGVDFSPRMVELARGSDQTGTQYLQDDIEQLEHVQSYDAVLLLDTINSLHDVQKALSDIRVKLCHDHTRLVIVFHNALWSPLLRLAERLRLKSPMPPQNWLSRAEVRRFLSLARFEVVTEGNYVLCPWAIPLIAPLCNRVLARLPILRHLCLSQFIVARPIPYDRKEYSVSIIIAARNEAGNIERAVQSIPKFGNMQEIVFVEGGSKDDTWEVIQDVAKRYGSTHSIQALKQTGKGLADAYRLAMNHAQHDLLMILNGDLTVDPSELSKFYDSFAAGSGEFLNGSRFVYPMEQEAMRHFNVLGNIAFSWVLSFLLRQRVRDTLCGTKVFLRSDYQRMARTREITKDLDPFGDFTFLAGAGSLQLKIIDIPVRYKARTYGATNIQRWGAGSKLLRLCARLWQKTFWF